MAHLPEGTLTFMLTDLQGSTLAWENQPKAMILSISVGAHQGELVEAGREGDSVLAVFKTAATAASCALDVQKNFAVESWPDDLDLRVRVALHTGEAQLRESHYFGPALNRCARLLATCHPGQILLTKATEAMLADEVPPGAELQDLGLHRFKDLARSEQVFQLTDVTRPSKFPPIQSLEHRRTNIPHYLTNFVGRTWDLSALKSALAKSRMVTLTGAGGSGKTRLAAELGSAYLDLWPGGVWWVELAPLSDERQVAGAVVSALELPGRGLALDVVTAWLAVRRAMLILDNCEHLVGGCAQFCDVALQRCAELTILATSREALGVEGEAR
jgi:class 3 adenylate cyclase